MVLVPTRILVLLSGKSTLKVGGLHTFWLIVIHRVANIRGSMWLLLCWRMSKTRMRAWSYVFAGITLPTEALSTAPTLMSRKHLALRRARTWRLLRRTILWSFWKKLEKKIQRTICTCRTLSWRSAASIREWSIILHLSHFGPCTTNDRVICSNDSTSSHATSQKNEPQANHFW